MKKGFCFVILLNGHKWQLDLLLPLLMLLRSLAEELLASGKNTAPAHIQLMMARSVPLPLLLLQSHHDVFCFFLLILFLEIASFSFYFSILHPYLAVLF